MLLTGRDAAQVAVGGSENLVRVRFGSTGDLVKTVQTALEAAGHNVHGVDGAFGNRTLTALLAFQESEFGVGGDDGIVGPQTAKALAITWPVTLRPHHSKAAPEGIPSLWSRTTNTDEETDSRSTKSTRQGDAAWHSRTLRVSTLTTAGDALGQELSERPRSRRLRSLSQACSRHRVAHTHPGTAPNLAAGSASTDPRRYPYRHVCARVPNGSPSNTLVFGTGASPT